MRIKRKRKLADPSIRRELVIRFYWREISDFALWPYGDHRLFISVYIRWVMR